VGRCTLRWTKLQLLHLPRGSRQKKRRFLGVEVTPASDPVQWTDQCQLAFEKVKQALYGKPRLHTPNFSLPVTLQTDASNRGLGAVLPQQVEGVDRPVLYISRKLSEREGRYSTVEEGLAIRWPVDYLRYYLLDRSFTLWSDHAPLQRLHRTKDTNARITRCDLERFREQSRKRLDWPQSGLVGVLSSIPISILVAMEAREGRAGRQSA